MKWNLYKTLVWICLILGLLLCVWAMLSIQLNIIPKININLSNDFCVELNQVYLNIAYSYVAAFIFYVVITVIPHKMEKKKWNNLYYEG